MKEIKIGDKVRSFDFIIKDIEGERACYMEGTVTNILAIEDTPNQDCPRYEIKVVKRIFSGFTEKNIPEFIYPPVNGTPSTITIGGVTDCVEKI